MNNSTRTFFLAFFALTYCLNTLSMNWRRTIINSHRDDKPSNSRTYNPVINTHDSTMRETHRRATLDHLNKEIPRNTSSGIADDSDDDTSSDEEDWNEKEKRRVEMEEKGYQDWCRDNKMPDCPRSRQEYLYGDPTEWIYTSPPSLPQKEMEKNSQKSESELNNNVPVISSSSSWDIYEHLLPFVSNNEKTNYNQPNLMHPPTRPSSPVTIDLSEFDALEKSSNVASSVSPSSSIPQLGNSQRDSSSQPTNSKNNRQKEKEFKETPSFWGLDNNEFPDPEAKKKDAEARERQIKAKTYKAMNEFLGSEEVPSYYKAALNEAVGENLEGRSDFNRTRERFDTIRQDYKREVLNQLRISDDLNDEQIALRRGLEHEFSSEEQASRYLEDDVRIDAEMQADIDENINFFHLFTRKLGRLKEGYRNKKLEALNRSLDAVSDDHKNKHHEQQKREQEEQEAAAERNNEKRKRIKESAQERNEDRRLRNKSGLDAHSFLTKTPLTLADTEFTIEPDGFDPEDDLLAPGLDAVDLIKTGRTRDFLEKMDVDSVEFNNFKGYNPSQNACHKSLFKALEYAHNLGIEVAPHVLEMQQELIKAAYILNTQNFTEFAQELLDLSNPYTLGLAFRKELINTVGYLVEYIKKLLYGLPDISKSNEPLIDRYERVQAAIKEIAQKTQELKEQNPLIILLKKNQKDYKSSIEKRQKIFAENAIGSLVEFGVAMAIGKAVDLSGLERMSARYRMRNSYAQRRGYEIIVEPTVNPRPSHALVESLAERGLPHSVENVLNQEIISIAQKPASPTKFSPSAVVGPEAVSDIISQELAVEIGLAESLANAGEKECGVGKHSLPKEKFKSYTAVVKDGVSKIVETVFTTEEALEILNNSKELKQLNEKVNQLKHIATDTKFGLAEEKLNHSMKLFEKAIAKTEQFYEKMRNTTEDIEKIHHNTGIPKDILQKIKDHVFNEEHILSEVRNEKVLKRFEGDIDMADGWNRLMNGDFVQSDLLLLEHELAESLIMRGNKVDYTVAHQQIVNKLYDWRQYLNE